MSLSTRLTLRHRAALCSLAVLALLVIVWEAATLPDVPTAKIQTTASAEATEYAMLMGKIPETGAADSAPAKVTGFPTPAQFVEEASTQIAHPFHDDGPNDKGIGIQLGFSLVRVATGYILALLVAVPLGFLIGMSELAFLTFNPFIQVLKPISPLAWMPIALYTIKSSSASAVFVIFICSVWPMLVNTVFGVAAVRRDWLNVARTLEVPPLRRALTVILPAAAPTIVTGMRISMGIAWLVIVAAEMLVGGTGIGYFLWNEWNNLSLSNVLFSVLLIGLVGMGLDFLFAQLQRKVTYVD
ncbi:ABC transporter permease [Burkholderia sp. PAMC 26561]|uniref:ABC transporter permease n=1 Tax=Burkholderia sp. PAMC 26561 TaxID=1795043 RepID=UPI00076AE91D|nr:ABC transporter permease subunit [Burkholderia sp. PAMC 26561]AME27019.1 nitrate ABC transporter permease [Burkholderia sp. PAMC 26561]AME27836.1 nitrate ABC transporter permease [Burkholderia sp. PAMC 26561]